MKQIIAGCLVALVTLVACEFREQTGHLNDANTVALWRFDEAAATDSAADVAGPYVLQQFGGPDVVAGQIGGGRSLNGSTRFFQKQGDLALGTVFNGNWTYEGWVSLDPAFSVGAILFIYNGLQFSLLDSDVILAQVGVTAARKVNFYQWQSTASYTTIESTATLETGRYHHVAVTRSAQGGNLFTYRIYIDGVLDTTEQDVAGPSTPLTGEFHYIGLGNYTDISGFGVGSSVLHGRLDDTRISDIARSASAILDSYERGLE